MRTLAAVAAIAASLLMTELALTRIFSVVMYYHFAFLAISIALFGLSASGVYAYLRRRGSSGARPRSLLAREALVYAASTSVALFALVRLRVGLNYSPSNLALMLAIYALAAIPFFTGGLVLTLAISRLAARINVVYAADLTGAALGCLVLIPLLNLLGAPGVVLVATALAALAAVLFFRHHPAAAVSGWRRRCRAAYRWPLSSPASEPSTSPIRKDTRATASCSASGIRSPGSACTNAPTATGR